MRKRDTLLRSIVILSILFFSLPVGWTVRADSPTQVDPQQQAEDLLAKMTPEERVGQLFLVTFKGHDIENNPEISDLITGHHIGGVILRAANDNFTGPDGTVEQASTMVNSLQSLSWQASQTSAIDTNTRKQYQPQYVPLFVGVSQEGDGYPYDQIISGMTQLPNLMAIGATWNTNLSEQVGAAIGQELEAVGINLLLGPSLDVLDVLHTEGGEDMGTRTFGGDPFWVGELGKSYITGLHEGSGNRLAVIAKHFPGRGGSDRPPEDEVATVRKSLEQLKQIELAPFFDVTGNAPSPEATTDGLLVSHIRYQGFQGNIRATTRPVSLDQAALDQLLGLPEFASWRQSGGVMVSDDLGSQGIKRFYSPLEQSFDARQVARSAFLAGNDLLYVDNFIATGDPDPYTTIVNTIEFFAQKYREDQVFAQRVDASVERLLTLKFKLYPEFSLDKVVPPANELTNVGKTQSLTFTVAQDAATLVSPDPSELAALLPRPPESSDRIVFVTDTMDARQCTHCISEPVFPVTALQDAVMRLYGPQAGAQVLPYKLSSYSFSNLIDLVNGMSSQDTETKVMEEDLRSADWIVFSILNVNADRPSSSALRRMLSERSDMLRNKRVIVFAFNAPYYLDATDITKLSAYYALYSKTPAFIDLAARLLFQEAQPAGSLPVSVPGIGYDLIAATSPDPNQVIPLTLDVGEPNEPEESPTSPTGTPEPTPAPTFKVGDVLPLRTGVIYDQNNHVVPDGTVARFTFTLGGESGITQQIEGVTMQGVARAAYRIPSPGLLEIHVSSDPAQTSELLRLDVSEGVGAVMTRIAPPTPTPTATATPNPSETSSPVPPTPTPTVIITAPPSAGPGEWFLSMFLIWGMATAIFYAGRQMFSLIWGVRWGLLVALGGLAAYVLYFLLVTPGSDRWINQGGVSGLSFAIVGGSLAGWLCGRLWQLQMERRARQRASHPANSTESRAG